MWGKRLARGRRAQARGGLRVGQHLAVRRDPAAVHAVCAGLLALFVLSSDAFVAVRPGMYW